MPQLFPSASSSRLQQQSLKKRHATSKRSSSVLHPFHKIGGWLRKDDDGNHVLPDRPSHLDHQSQTLEKLPASTQELHHESVPPNSTSPGNSLLERSLPKSNKLAPGVSPKFNTKRQNSEKRKRLLAINPSATEKRAVSAERRLRKMSPSRCLSAPFAISPSHSAPDISTPSQMRVAIADAYADGYFGSKVSKVEHGRPDCLVKHPLCEDVPPLLEAAAAELSVLDDREIQAELEAKWILNLSVHFRDNHNREKFYITYAPQPNRWCKVTVSCDYMGPPPFSLETDLKSLKFQRDKNQRIYEAIRESLPDIQFYDTVTNLRLETEDGQLHVHVTEDTNEIITYPSVNLVQACRKYRESEIEFQSHISGFVYKVSVDGQLLIKKEIPGPDNVDEFLYEIEVLNELRDSKNVIDFHGLVVDDDEKLVKGLLISYAQLGPLTDLLYDYKLTSSLPWHRRERWAHQIIQGLSEIHDAGFVQGDFTLSNIVVDYEDDAKIIDINRRGCPIGWESPEILRLVGRGQRVSMFISVKSDIFQLGMVLWALAQQDDEPEQVKRTSTGVLPRITAAGVPNWFEDIIDGCLSVQPRYRPSARELLSLFPREHETRHSGSTSPGHDLANHRSYQERDNPAGNVDWDDVEEFKREQQKPTDFPRSHPTTDPYQFIVAAGSTEYRADSNASYVIPHRGRSDYRRGSAASSTTSLSLSQGPPMCEYICAEDLPGYDFTAGKSERHADARHERPAVPTAPPFRGDGLIGLDEVAHDNHERDQERIPRCDQDVQHSARQHRVLFGPPVHQDSGFDENMVDAIEHGEAVIRPAQSGSPTHTLPRLLTSSFEAPDDGCQEASAVSRHSELVTSPACFTQDTASPHSPSSPITPFSYRTPLASPFCPAEEQDGN
jgi:serine/threonine protein kinase